MDSNDFKKLPRSDNMVKTSVQLDKATVEILKRENINVSKLIRQLVQDFILKELVQKNKTDKAS